MCAVLAAFTFFGVYRNESTARAEAQAELAMELTTEAVLTQKNADARLPMASTTKILTAIIIVEDCNLEEVITVPDCAVGTEGSSIYLKKDEQINIIDLLYGLCYARATTARPRLPYITAAVRKNLHKL